MTAWVPQAELSGAGPARAFLFACPEPARRAQVLDDAQPGPAAGRPRFIGHRIPIRWYIAQLVSLNPSHFLL